MANKSIVKLKPMKPVKPVFLFDAWPLSKKYGIPFSAFQYYEDLVVRVFLFPLLKKKIRSEKGKLKFFYWSPVYERMRTEGISLSSLHPYNNSYIEFIWNWTENFVRRWSTSLFKDLSFDGIKGNLVAKILERRLIEQILVQVFYAVGLIRFCQIHEPDEVILAGFGSTIEFTLDATARSLGLKVTYLIPRCIEKLLVIPIKILLALQNLYDKVSRITQRSEFRNADSIASQSSARNLMFFAFHPTHLSSILPLAKRFGMEGFTASVVVSKYIKHALRNFSTANARLFIFEDYVSGYQREDNLSKLHYAEKRVRKELSQSEYAVCMHSRLGLLMHSILYKWTVRNLTSTISKVLAARRIVKELNPNLVVHVGDGRIRERALILEAHRVGSKTIAIQAGLLGAFFRYEGLPDVIAVFGEAFRRFLIEQGLPSDSVKVTGNPSISLVAKDKFRLERSTKSKRKKIVLYTSQFAWEGIGISRVEKYLLCKEILKISQNQDYFVIVKLHPNDDGMIERTITRNGSPRVIVVKGPGLDKLLTLSDVVVTISSTTALEGLLREKPVVIVNTTGHKAFVNRFAEEDMAVLVDHIGSVAPSIKTILEDKQTLMQLKGNIKKRICNYVCCERDEAINNIINLIKNLSKSSR
jgi:hypothetical protein